MYAFVLGKNRELSKEELLCYFEKNNIKYSIKSEGKQFLIIDAKIDTSIIKDLGGTIKIGEVKTLSELKQMNFEKVFGISVYDAPIKARYKLRSIIRDAMKEQGIKTKIFQTRKDELTSVEVIKKDLIGKEILILRTWLAVTQGVYDPFEYKELDTGRPKQRGMLSIPIRLSKIMVNLAKLKKNDKMLDPFCGYGTMLQAGLMSGADVYGSDNDLECVESAKENLEWLKKKYKTKNKFTLKNADVLKIYKSFKKEYFDGIVTESYMGPPLRKSVTDERAKELITELTEFYESMLNQLTIVLKKGKRIVIVFPVIITKNKKYKIKVNTKLKLIKTIEDIHPKHITGREIFIFEK